jgi:hypothetical protein
MSCLQAALPRPNRGDTVSQPTIISPVANYFFATKVLMARAQRGDDRS